jgi:hypothetical protein
VHDLVHRDGKTINDESHFIDENAVNKGVGVMESFANEIFESLVAAMKDLKEPR